MEVELARLTHVPRVVSGAVDIRVDERDAAGRTLAEDGIRAPRPLQLDAKVWKAGEKIIVAGQVEGTIQVQCGRCLTLFPHAVDVTFESTYAPAVTAPAAETRAERAARAAHADPDGVELAADDLDVSFLPRGAATLDLRDVAREQVLLDLPFRPLCKEGCAGLCARCGSDLNEGPCPCPPQPEANGDSRLQALAELRKRLDDGGRGVGG